MATPPEQPPYDLAADYESGRVSYRWQCRRCKSGRGVSPRADQAVQAAEIHAVSHINDESPRSETGQILFAVLVVIVGGLAVLGISIGLTPGWVF